MIEAKEEQKSKISFLNNRIYEGVVTPLLLLLNYQYYTFKK